MSGPQQQGRGERDPQLVMGDFLHHLQRKAGSFSGIFFRELLPYCDFYFFFYMS